MARVEWKQGNPDTVFGFSRSRMDTDKNPFLPPVQASASELPVSSS